ncbi:hypothetical protein SAMN02746066_04346 [Anaerosporobacter mobilis DSM 15930]|jgi:hypothetical protein|uniref:Uncharacterized protein n=1 Tax=Anaerosporobacter mobilis DSM 15930 TaxID=1120996 RepID=A0A1M7NAS0_9FIRM|nr:hypothetical protein [Anaerosporobacter mobilis]SHN00681.1 hypothetical protein SAMN02746066_04346 [Anaerosporobacter mobilis DSM 15930]
MNESKIINENNSSTLSRLQNLPGLNILPSDCYGDDIDCKLEMLAFAFNDIYLRTKKELKGIFSLNEAMGISQSYCGTLISQCNKDSLLTNVKSSIYYDEIDKLFSFDGAILMDKLTRLTEFQCLTVIGMVNEFRMASNGIMVPNEVVNKIFMIE